MISRYLHEKSDPPFRVGKKFSSLKPTVFSIAYSMQIIRSIFKFVSSSSLSKSKTQNQLQRTMATAAERRSKRLKRRSERLVWVDLEMSGLDIEKEHILEMACLVTDADLNIIAETEDLVIHQPDSVLDGMDEWCTKHHGESGLTEAVRKSKISLSDAENRMLEFVREHTLPGKAPLAGNSIHMDRMFLAKYMPKFTQHLHYRLVDVSTIKELSRRWYTREFSEAPKKKLSHRALDDIKESIAELQYYRENVFKPIVDNNEASSGDEIGGSNSD